MNAHDFTSPKLFLSVLILTLSASLVAQDSARVSSGNKSLTKSRLFIGSQIPVDFTAGYSYQFNDRYSAAAHVGFITKPYSSFLINAMQTFGMDENLGKVIKKAFRTGGVYGIGPTYHFKKTHVGVFGQYMHLKGGGITPADALSVYFKKDFTPLNVNSLPAFEFSMQSNLVNVGALFGYVFQLRNPRLSINSEASLSKIIGSKNTFSSNRTLIDRTAFVQNIYREIDDEMRDAFIKYGFIPSLNLYLVYHL